MNLNLHVVELTIAPEQKAAPPIYRQSSVGPMLLGAALILCALMPPMNNALFRWAPRGPGSARGAIVLSLIGLMLLVLLTAVSYLSAWIALGPERFVRRMTIGWSLFLAGGVLLLGGIRSVEHMPSLFGMQFLGVLVWMLLCVQGPLWIARYFLRLRLTHKEVVAAAERWTFRDWAAGSVVIGAALALLRPAMERPSEVLGALATGGVCFTAEAVFLPVVWVMLSTAGPSTCKGWIAAHVGLLASPLVFMLVLWPLPNYYAYVAAIVLFSCFIAAVYSGLGALRAGGYRLTRDAPSTAAESNA